MRLASALHQRRNYSPTQVTPMPIDYKRITQENIKRYGTDIDEYGPVLLSNRYSDRTHFVYELLQNAEDAIGWRLEREKEFSGEVAFELDAHGLLFRHFGLPFAEEHVRGICNIGKGTKQQDLSAIGTHGIGFKSVYAYTHHPEVHSGDEHFVIDSFVRPCHVPVRVTSRGETRFFLPFDHPDVSAKDAYREIAGRLKELGLRTLLFVRNIDSISWQLTCGTKGQYVREAKPVREGIDRILLRGQDGTGTGSVEQWLVFRKPVSDGERPAGFAEVAFRIIRDEKRDADSIAAVSESPLVVYFPTEKETHFGFLIQGPYKTTPSRDNIPRDDRWNRYLVTQTAEVLVWTLTQLRDLRLMNIDALESMIVDLEKYEPGAQAAMFRPIADAIIITLMNERLIPSFRGGHLPGSIACIARAESLRSLVSHAQLSEITDSKSGWVTGEITRDRTPVLRSFLVDSVGVRELDGVDFVRDCSDKFLRKQSDEWLKSAEMGSGLIFQNETRPRFRPKYGYDRASNRIWKENVVAANNGKDFDEFYTYDGLHRLQNFDRGDLNASRTAISGTPANEEDWTLDALGNWSNFIQKTSGTTDLNQSRTVNEVNEITDITETTGPSWMTPVFDRNGNMTTVPKPADPTIGFTCTYDAWNRMVKVEEGMATVGEYAYDALKRRITKDVDSTVRHFLYSSQWESLEERLDSSSDPERQHIWGPQYVDQLIYRDRDTSDPANGTLDERLYGLQDANWNVTALVDTGGGPVERYLYEPYGTLTYQNASFGDSSSSVDNAYTFTGRRRDSETGVWQYRTRYLGSQLGSFLRRDPIGNKIDENFYRYASGSPGRYTDPSGLASCVPQGCGVKTWPCGLYSIPGFGIGLAMPFAIALKFNKPCNCCEYRQYVSHSIRVRFKERGKWGPWEYLFEEGEVEEDCRVDENGKAECYGRKTQPPSDFDNYDPTGCEYFSFDAPGYYGVVDLFKKEPGLFIEIDMRYRFVLNVEDVCCANVKSAYAMDLHCQQVITSFDKPIPFGPGAAGGDFKMWC